MQNIFVYGSLLFEEITKGLTGKSFKTAKAILPGFKRCSVFDADYPALLNDQASKVEGKILFDVDQESMEVLTFFEGSEYSRTKSMAVVQDKKIPVTVFIWIGEKEPLHNKDWNKKKFETDSLTLYTKSIIPETLKEIRLNKEN